MANKIGRHAAISRPNAETPAIYPLIAFMIANSWLWPGNSALRRNQALQRALVNATGWWELKEEDGTPVEGIELTRFTYHPACGAQRQDAEPVCE